MATKEMTERLPMTDEERDAIYKQILESTSHRDEEPRTPAWVWGFIAIGSMITGFFATLSHGLIEVSARSELRSFLSRATFYTLCVIVGAMGCYFLGRYKGRREASHQAEAR